MSAWKRVGEWLKGNAGTGAALVGSLLTGNVPGAVAAGAALVSSATGTTDPDAALAALQGTPDALVRLRELSLANEADIRRHLETMTQQELEARQREHETTQETIRAGDRAEDPFVRRTRPAQSWFSLFAAVAYIFSTDVPDVTILGLLLTLPWAYAGLREIGKGVSAVTAARSAKR